MTTQPASIETPAKISGVISRLNEFALEGVLLAICIFLAMRAPGFTTSANILNIMRNVSQQGIIAFGMTLVIIMGDIDLSVGSAVAWSGCLVAVITRDLLALGHPAALAIPLAMLVAIALCGLGGILTGWLRTRFNVPAFVTTLALMYGYKGGAYLITNSFPVIPFPENYSYFGSGYLLGVPFSAVVFVAVFAIMYVISKYTTFGRAVYAIGGNLESARLSGINVGRTKMAVFAITGALAAISGIIVSSMCMAGTPQAGSGWELDVIASVIIGGVSLSGGGKGRIWGTFVGVIFLGVIGNGMTLLNVNEFAQYIVKAILILSAVLIYQRQEGKK